MSGLCQRKRKSNANLMKNFETSALDRKDNNAGEIRVCVAVCVGFVEVCGGLWRFVEFVYDGVDR